MRPGQNGRHFADAIFKCIFLNENVWIRIKISLKFVPKGPINNIPSLVQIMAWHRPGDKPLSEPMMARLPTHIYASLGLNELRRLPKTGRFQLRTLAPEAGIQGRYKQSHPIVYWDAITHACPRHRPQAISPQITSPSGHFRQTSWDIKWRLRDFLYWPIEQMYPMILENTWCARTPVTLTLWLVCWLCTIGVWCWRRCVVL